MIKYRSTPFVMLMTIPLLFFSRQHSIAQSSQHHFPRQRITLNEGWLFYRYDSTEKADDLVYDVRPPIADNAEQRIADAKPTDAVNVEVTTTALKPWILPTANAFIKNPDNKYVRPDGNPGSDFPFVQNDFDDARWQKVTFPHDWAITAPFMTGNNPTVGGGMGRLPSHGVAWYRKKLDIPSADAGKSIFLDVDGAMSYAIVWLNGKLLGGWPYGYNSWRIDLTKHLNYGGVNQLAIRLDNPNHSARWYPGGGLYRNVWLTKTNHVHISQSGTFVTTTEITPSSAKVNIAIDIDNDSDKQTNVRVATALFLLNKNGKRSSTAVANMPVATATVTNNEKGTIQQSVSINNPRLWGPPPSQQPNLYVAVTSLTVNGEVVDEYETRFGVRSLVFDALNGLLVNGERIQLKGVNQHHDLGALGAAFNTRAAARQLEILKEMGCNAIRMAHNPPAPELLDLTDRMGFLVFDEIFDSWKKKKTPHDFHLIFPEWHEADTRNFIRRDRNHPSVIMWGIGNEVGEQYTGEEGAAIASKLYDLVKEEDPTRPVTCAMNYAKPDMALPAALDIISVNYQGEGIRQDPEFEGTERIRTPPQYTPFHEKFPEKMILSSETASAFSSRGIYLFPVSKELSAPVRDDRGGDSNTQHVTSYELHAVDFGSSAEKVFATLERHPFVAGEFVWTGWDYLGEPTPYYQSRSSYSGIIDLAGFKKDRFYLYQSHWRKDFPMVHILPHWNWPERIGQVTPIHVFTSGDEADLFVNGKSQGRKKKEKYVYRLRWDDVRYEPGTIKVVAYKDGKVWATEKITTSGEAGKVMLSADRNALSAMALTWHSLPPRLSIRMETLCPMPTA